jgi:hypothetical protein
MNHHTHEQDVVKARARIGVLKAEYARDLTQFIGIASDDTTLLRATALACQKSGTSYFNYAEEFVGTSDLLGANRSALWAQGFAEDCAEILGSLPAHIEFLKAAFYKTGLPVEDDKFIPGKTAYANMQRMVVKYLKGDLSKDLEDRFKQSKLPTYGFENVAREFMSKKLQMYLSFGFGVVFVVIMLTIALLKPDPSNFQYSVFKTVLALAGGGVACMIPGFIEVRVGPWVRAGGAIAVFVVLYFFSPASLVVSHSTPENNQNPISISK